MSPVVLITGTSSGIGLATAVQAAQAGYRVVATMRDTAKDGRLKEAASEAGVEVDVRRLDVTDAASVRAAVDGVIADYGQLDAVVNNAGAGHVGTVETDDVANFRSVMEVNFFGVVELTKAALPHLRASSGRLVTVTSVGGVVGQPFNEAYCAAKFAVEGMMESLAPVAAAQGVTVTVVEPGAVASEFVNNVQIDRGAIFEQMGVYAGSFKNYMGRTGDSFAAAQTSDEAARTVVEALTAQNPAFRVQTSEWAREFTGRKLADNDGSAVQELTRGWIA
ncbi:SDR family NAD(P)-dependent oxidoreductase [Lentzea tibetensis]|uniref:SDR family NAD(P)-dependent oxidoreductase n=1 Tax=Lentzea tibetensis TaxID=2591470 RepID=A0A563EHL7_9PSEU|nr:SDR family NAD(P)-dependent oxidoreductase [Lentzea tibetensis]TWP46119.1 SDR family NAD(P)-dependent oxidoreductase [Lentzea tibetensis]